MKIFTTKKFWIPVITALVILGGMFGLDVPKEDIVVVAEGMGGLAAVSIALYKVLIKRNAGN